MVEIFKYISQIEEQLLKNDFQNSQIKNIILDSFILGHISGGQRDSIVKFSEFKRSLEIVQQLRNLIEINALKQEQLIELYNNVFTNYEDIQALYAMIEFQLFDNKVDFNQKQFPIKQENSNTQNKLWNQQQNQTVQIQTQNQNLMHQEKQNFQNFSNFNNNQSFNFNQNFRQFTNVTNDFQPKTQPLFIPPQKQQFKQFDIFQTQQNQQNFPNFNKFPLNNNNQQQPQSSQKFQAANVDQFTSINPIGQTISGQFQQNPFLNKQSQIKFQQQPFKQQEFQNKNPFQQQFQEKQQYQNQFPNSDTFIINEMKQIRESVTASNNQNQQQELRKTQNIARIQQQYPPVHNFQMKIQQQQKQQIKQEQDENKQLEQQSIILAQKLQSEFDQEDLDNVNYDFTKDCDICFVKLDLEEMIVLDCGHIFHLNCLNQTCLTQMQSRYFPINCPNQYCKKPIIYNDLAIILDKVNLELYQQLTFQQYIDSHGDEYSWCPTPDCKFVFISEGENHFQCPVCSKQYCLNCKAEFHHGQTCEQYMSFKNMNQELDQQFYQFVQGAKFKQCPKCKFWVEKNTGCNHMTCRCRFEFCYTCGQDYKLQCKCKDNQNFHRNPLFQNWPRFRHQQF